MRYVWLLVLVVPFVVVGCSFPGATPEQQARIDALQARLGELVDQGLAIAQRIVEARRRMEARDLPLREGLDLVTDLTLQSLDVAKATLAVKSDLQAVEAEVSQGSLPRKAAFWIYTVFVMFWRGLPSKGPAFFLQAGFLAIRKRYLSGAA